MKQKSLKRCCQNDYNLSQVPPFFQKIFLRMPNPKMALSWKSVKPRGKFSGEKTNCSKVIFEISFHQEIFLASFNTEQRIGQHPGWSLSRLHCLPSRLVRNVSAGMLVSMTEEQAAAEGDQWKGRVTLFPYGFHTRAVTNKWQGVVQVVLDLQPFIVTYDSFPYYCTLHAIKI